MKMKLSIIVAILVVCVSDVKAQPKTTSHASHRFGLLTLIKQGFQINGVYGAIFRSEPGKI